MQHRRSVVAGIKMSTVFVYSGKGSDRPSQKKLYHVLKDTVDHSFHDVKFISAAQIRQGAWMSKTKLICFGGGRDLGFIESLGENGLRNIRDFVRCGGSYLGICAGAYFACDFIEFDKNGPLDVCGERYLKFYKGKCVGPAFKGFDYTSRKGVHAVPVLYKDKVMFNAYMEGGGYFVSDQPSSETKTEMLGSYQSLENSPEAVVKCQFGQGLVVLSGVHLEFSVDQLNHKDPYLRRIIPQFCSSEGKRKHVFKDVLSNLGVICCDDLGTSTDIHL